MTPSSSPPPEVDDIVLGEVLRGGGDIARYVAVELGMIDVPGLAHNRHCASSLASVQTAAAGVMAGMDRVVIAGGRVPGRRADDFRPCRVGAVGGPLGPWAEPWTSSRSGGG